MATTNPNDKHAFLFSGPAGDMPVRDLEKVADTLVRYYNYPPTQITVAMGTTPSPMPSFSGAAFASVGSVTSLTAELTNFASMANTAGKTVLLYFTGFGVRESGVSKLGIDGGATPTTVDPTWLETRLNAFGSAQVNVVMQQSYSGGFNSALTGSTLSDWTFTAACAADEEAYGDLPFANGGYFTDGWTRGLQMETLPAGTTHVGQYADELGTGGETTNRLISLEEDSTFGSEIQDVYLLGTGFTATTAYASAGTQQYLGEPELVIRDGSPWYESPDINLTHPNDPSLDPGNEDLYVPDPVGATAPFNNTVNIDVRNMGTHPVRAYSLSLELFQMGGGGAGDKYSDTDIVPTGALLYPMLPAAIDTLDDKKHTFPKNIMFVETSVHRCVKVEAEYRPGELDYSWDPSAADNEGQRNIDILPIAPALPEAPEPIGNIRGMKQHIFNIGNPFDTPRDFQVVFPPDYFKFTEVLDLEWLQVPTGPQAEKVPIPIEQEPVPHLFFTLKSKEERRILLNVRLRPGTALEEDIRLPFEITVKGQWMETDNIRWPEMTDNLPNAAAMAGFTVVIRKGTATLEGNVLDREGKPAAGARVLLRTVNNLQGAVVTADRNGTFALENINPDIYYIKAETEDWHAPERMAVLTRGKAAKLDLPMTEEAPTPGSRIRVIVDKIRVMDDHDPCIKGKGELLFTAVVVPDNDRSRKQVVRLPERGVYHVSDKPGRNEILPEAVIFDGVVKNHSLSIMISGKEIDLFDPDDELTRYHRVFSGEPSKWYGEYAPTADYLNRRDVADWAVWYRIVRG